MGVVDTGIDEMRLEFGVVEVLKNFVRTYHIDLRVIRERLFYIRKVVRCLQLEVLQHLPTFVSYNDVPPRLSGISSKFGNSSRLQMSIIEVVEVLDLEQLSLYAVNDPSYRFRIA